jgi:hypothetical protein
MRQGKAEERGVVLALVLVVTAGIAFLGFEAMRMARVDLAGSSVLRSRVLDVGLMDAGFSLARDMLLQDFNAYDGPFDVWNYLPVRSENLSLAFTVGSVTGIIEDENSRFAVNSMSTLGGKSMDDPYGILLRLVETLVLYHGLTGSPEAFVDEVHNWVRPAAATEGENNLDVKYLAQDVPIRVPHRYMRSIEELLLILWPGSRKGDVEILFYGTEQIPGLRDLLTVHAWGPLNLNTAHRLLIFAVPTDNDPERKNRFVERALNYRNSPLNSLGWEWYEEIAQQVGLEGTGAFELCGIVSSTFRVSITATTGLGRRHAVAIVERRTNQITRSHLAL